MGVLSWAVVVEGSQDFGKCMSRGKSNIPAEKSTRILTFFFFFHSDATGFSCVVGDLGVNEGYIRLHNDDYRYIRGT